MFHQLLTLSKYKVLSAADTEQVLGALSC
jgi:hypothetical protein